MLYVFFMPNLTWKVNRKLSEKHVEKQSAIVVDRRASLLANTNSNMARCGKDKLTNILGSRISGNASSVDIAKQSGYAKIETLGKDAKLKCVS